METEETKISGIHLTKSHERALADKIIWVSQKFPIHAILRQIFQEKLL